MQAAKPVKMELSGRNERKKLDSLKRDQGGAGIWVVKFLTQSLKDTPVGYMNINH